MLLADVQERVEKFAPKAARAERKRLYSKILDALSAVQADSCEDILAGVLAAIVARNGFIEAKKLETDRRPSPEVYRKEERRARKLLDQLNASWIVKDFGPDAVDFYGFDEARCPHGRWRKNCEAIRGALISAQAARAAGRNLRRKPASFALLGEWNVAPDSDVGNFCERREAPRLLPPLAAPRRASGRPTKRHREITTTQVVGLLHHDGGLTIEQSCEFIADLYRDCLKIEADAESLRQDWYSTGARLPPLPDDARRKAMPKTRRVKKPR